MSATVMVRAVIMTAALLAGMVRVPAGDFLPLRAMGGGFRNVYGIEGLHGGASEWTEDFRPDALTSCAGAAMGASDATNYPAFRRESFRSALTGRSTVRTLGFRCAK